MASFNNLFGDDTDIIRDAGATAGQFLRVATNGTDLVPYDLISGVGTNEVLTITTVVPALTLQAIRVGRGGSNSPDRTQVIVQATGTDLTGIFQANDVVSFRGAFPESGDTGNPFQVIDIDGNNASPVDTNLDYSDASTVFGGSNSASNPFSFGYKITPHDLTGTSALPTLTTSANWTDTSGNYVEARVNSGFTFPLLWPSNPVQVSDANGNTTTDAGYTQTWLVALDLNQPPFTSYALESLDFHIAGSDGLGFDGIHNGVYPANYDVTDDRRLEYYVASILSNTADWTVSLGTTTEVQQVVIDEYADDFLEIAGINYDGAVLPLTTGPFGTAGQAVVVNQSGDGLEFSSSISQSDGAPVQTSIDVSTNTASFAAEQSPTSFGGDLANSDVVYISFTSSTVSGLTNGQEFTSIQTLFNPSNASPDNALQTWTSSWTYYDGNTSPNNNAGAVIIAAETATTFMSDNSQSWDTWSNGVSTQIATDGTLNVAIQGNDVVNVGTGSSGDGTASYDFVTGQDWVTAGAGSPTGSPSLSPNYTPLNSIDDLPEAFRDLENGDTFDSVTITVGGSTLTWETTWTVEITSGPFGFNIAATDFNNDAGNLTATDGSTVWTDYSGSSDINSSGDSFTFSGGPLGPGETVDLNVSGTISGVIKPSVFEYLAVSNDDTLNIGPEHLNRVVTIDTNGFADAGAFVGFNVFLPTSATVGDKITIIDVGDDADGWTINWFSSNVNTLTDRDSNYFEFIYDGADWLRPS